MSTEGTKLFQLTGKRALVTGASRGIGAAIAIGFARAGADVALVARSTAALDEVAGRIRALGREAVAIPCDVTVAQDIESTCARALAELGPIDVLVNNAGGPVFHSSVLEVREEGWQKVIDLNLTSVFRFCQRIGTGMVARGSGSVINVASVGVFRPWPAVTAYCVAKAGVVTLTQLLAAEWGPTGVRANALSPGWIRTEINRSYSGPLADMAVASVPLHRWGEPEEVADTALWLASDASRYVTGATITVDGGYAVGMPEDWLHAMDRSANDRLQQSAVA